MQEEKGATEDEMAGWHHRLNGQESGLGVPGASRRSAPQLLAFLPGNQWGSRSAAGTYRVEGHLHRWAGSCLLAEGLGTEGELCQSSNSCPSSQ